MTIIPVFQTAIAIAPDLQDLIRERMASEVPHSLRPREEIKLPIYDRGAEKRAELTPAVVAAHLEGKSMTAIGHDLHIAKDTVARILTDAGIEPRSSSAAEAMRIDTMTPEFIRAYAAGRTAVSIGKEYGVSAPAVIRRLRNAGVEIDVHRGKRRGSRVAYLREVGA